MDQPLEGGPHVVWACGHPDVQRLVLGHVPWLGLVPAGLQ